MIRRIVKKFANRVGYDITPYNYSNSFSYRRIFLFEKCKITHVIDVGANSGGYAMHLRKEVNYNGKITSFEPLTSAYAQLKINASKDDKWSVHNFAIGDKCGIEVINISKNSFSSSFLPMRQSYSVADPKTRYVDSEKVAVKTLDSVFSQLFTHNDNFLLKIDTQGFESKVLKGAERSLERIGMIQLEMSLTQIYEGESLFNDLYSLLVNKGYELMSIEPGYFNETTGQMLQVDGIFYRYPPANKFTG